MRGDAASMRVHRPRTAQEACRTLHRHPDAIPLAGGTDLLVSWNVGQLNDREMLDLSRIASWRRLQITDQVVRIGALVTFTRLRSDPEVRRLLPLLVAAAGTVGGRQIQNRATLAGNIANASPAGDSFPPLAVYDATVRVIDQTGARDLAFLDVFAGVKRTALRPGELIARIDIPRGPRPSRRLFRKVGTRAAQAISKVVVAGQLWQRRDGSVRELRLAMGSVAPTVVRLPTVEAAMTDRKLTPKNVQRAVDAVEVDISPIDDLRSTRDYRLSVARNLVRDFLAR